MSEREFLIERFCHLCERMLDLDEETDAHEHPDQGPLPVWTDPVVLEKSKAWREKFIHDWYINSFII